MKLSRAVFFPLLLASVLLFAQQAGAVHALHHALEGQAQHDNQLPDSHACEQCAIYGQLGSALGVSAHNFTPPPVSGDTIQSGSIAFRSIIILAAAARGPPAPLQTVA